MEQIVSQPSSGLRPKSERAIWGVLLLTWFVALCVVPDPRPLGAPEWSVRATGGLIGLSEPAARAVATIVLRASGLGLIGILVSLTLSSVRMRRAAPVALTAAPLVAVASQWINYGYFPVFAQIQLGVASAVLGALAGLALRRSRMALAALIILAVGLFAWGTSTGVSDELDAAARATGQYLLAQTEDIPPGDEGFTKLLRLAFSYAEDNSHRTDAVPANKAAILALGVILGEEKVAEVAGRRIDLGRVDEFNTLRRRVTLRGRNDLTQHFWVSAALTILSDESRSITVGIGKEMMDATPGGSGFSFVDLTADRAGTLFADRATSSEDSARELQMLIRRGLGSEDLCPDIQGLPEGIPGDEFQADYGGLGGEQTGNIVEEIQRRLSTCDGLANPR
jgi:hypothetical protein